MIKMETHGLMDLTEGLKDLHEELVALGSAQAQKTLRQAARKALKPVLEAARAGAPEDTGLTRDNIAIATQAGKHGTRVVVAGLLIRRSKESRQSKYNKTGKPRPVEYQSPHWRWYFIENGTSKKAARPFLRPALDNNAERVVVDLRGELRKAIDRVLKKRKKAATSGGR